MSTHSKRRTATRNLLRILSREEGQSMIMVALSLTVLIGFIGLAVDVGHFWYVQRNLQNAADAAALAGAMESRICGGVENCSVMQAAAQQAIVENGYTVGTFLTNCSGSPGASGLTLMLNNPTCAVSGDPNSGATKLNFVEAVVTQQVNTYFASILGFTSFPISARAEAERGIGGPCLYALDPTGAGAITLLAGVLVQSNCGIVDESNNSDALDCTLGLGIYAPRIDITGSASGLLGGILCGSTPPPKTHVAAPNPADPLAYLDAPSTANDSCGTTTSSPYYGSPHQVSIILGLGSTTVFHPGVYCGGINITAAVLSNVTFESGTYILRQGPGGLADLGQTGGLTITISALSSITGEGVTFYNETGSNVLANTLNITAPTTLGLSDFNLTAPTSGEYTGILFFQEHGNTAQDSFLLSLAQGSSMSGAVYAPDAQVFYGVSALTVSSTYNILVAKDISFLANVGSTFGNNYSTLTSGSPLNGDDVMLVQ